MPPADWPIFIAFLSSLGLLVLGLACLLCTEEMLRHALKWMKTQQNGRHLRIFGCMAICVGVPLTMIFAKKWFETWFI